MKRKMGILALAALAATLRGQVVAPKPGVIEGRVLDAASGAPLRKTALTLRPVGGAGSFTLSTPAQQVVSDPGAGVRKQYSATTDGEGRFSVTVDQPGDFRIGAEHTGYVRGEYGARRPGAGGKAISVAAGQRLSGIDVKLTPQGVIAGRVVDEDGDPLERAQVSVMARLAPNAGVRSTSVVTNDLGEFRAAGLAAGKYYLMANRIGVAVNSDAAQEIYAPTYFPGSTDTANAAAITVAPGQQVTGIFIPMRKTRVFKVSGVISGSIGDEPQPPANRSAPATGGTTQVAARAVNRVIVNLIERTDNSARGIQLNSRVMNADGSFEVPNVGPGSYWALAMSTQRGTVVVGRAPVEVRNGNVANVVVPVAPPVSLSGTVRVDGNEALSFAKTRLALNPVGDPIGGASSEVMAGGTFQFLNLSRARFRVVAANLPDGAYLKAIRVNGQEAAKGVIDLTSAPAAMAIEAIFSGKAATVNGTVKLGAESLPGQVLLVADPYVAGEMAAAPVGVPLPVNSNGAFTIRNAPPGKYRLYAFEDVDFQSIDAALLAKLQARSEKLTLDESAAASVELQQIPAEDSQPE